MLPKEFESLKSILTQCPSISSKQANKIVSFLLNSDYDLVKKRVNEFLEILNQIKDCEICGYYSVDKLCKICSSSTRINKLMIVENNDQIQKYEEWKIFNGKYFKMPILFNKKFERIESNFDFKNLLDYVDNFNEIIIGLSPTAEGVLTSNLIFDTIKKEKANINISSLAIGIPMGSSIDYMDQLTISYAIKNRKDIK